MLFSLSKGSYAVLCSASCILAAGLYFLCKLCAWGSAHLVQVLGKETCFYAGKIGLGHLTCACGSQAEMPGSCQFIYFQVRNVCDCSKICHAEVGNLHVCRALLYLTL